MKSVNVKIYERRYGVRTASLMMRDMLTSDDDSVDESELFKNWWDTAKRNLQTLIDRDGAASGIVVIATDPLGVALVAVKQIRPTAEQCSLELGPPDEKS